MKVGFHRRRAKPVDCDISAQQLSPCAYDAHNLCILHSSFYSGTSKDIINPARNSTQDRRLFHLGKQSDGSARQCNVESFMVSQFSEQMLEDRL